MEQKLEVEQERVEETGCRWGQGEEEEEEEEEKQKGELMVAVEEVEATSHLQSMEAPSRTCPR